MLPKQAACRMRKQGREGKLAALGGHPGQGAATAQCWDSFLFLARVKETPLSLTQAVPVGHCAETSSHPASQEVSTRCCVA